MADGIVSQAVEDYLDDLAHGDDPTLTAMESLAEEWGGFPIVGRAAGALLELQARAIGAERVFELGSGFGYSAYFFARAVGAGGEVVCTDLGEANVEKAEGFLTAAGVWDRVTYHLGDAGEALDAVDGEFDVIFCDADKERYPEHWRRASERIRVGGLYLCDNTLWYGRVATGEPTPDQPGWTEAIVEHNRLVSSDDRYLTSIAPIRDGVLIALRVR